MWTRSGNVCGGASGTQNRHSVAGLRARGHDLRRKLIVGSTRNYRASNRTYRFRERLDLLAAQTGDVDASIFDYVDPEFLAKPNRLIGGYSEQSHWAHPGFRPFIERDAFEISLVTTLPQKARRLAESLTAWGDARARMIKVCAIPELINLIAPLPTRIPKS